MNVPNAMKGPVPSRRRTSGNVAIFAAIGMADEVPVTREWLMYDRACPFCTRAAQFIEPLLARRGIAVVPLQTDWVRELLAARREPLLKEIRFLSARGELTGGADALLEVARRFWWARPAVWIAKLPPARRLMRRAYAAVAAQRHCSARRERKRGVGGALWTYGPAVLLSIAAIASRGDLPSWAYMWTVAAGLFFAAKWMTVARILAKGARPNIKRLLAYVFLWPGLNAQAFCFEKPVDAPARRGISGAMFKIAVGAAMVRVAIALVAESSLAAGWLAMVGMVLILHFGIFELLAQFWRSRGINARPLMQAPASATSISKLWSGRWNTAFTDLMHKEVFAPVANRRGAIAATVSVFLVSGLLHELVISAPARGGYGLPTAYFGLQCAGVLIERSSFGAKMGLGRGAVGWVFVVMVAALPAVMLFPPLFVRNVIVPMLEILN